MVLHLAFLFMTPFEHHDFVCHLKTPLHCTACASSPLSSDPHSLQAPDTSLLTDAGRAVAYLHMSQGAVLIVRSAGRSPPAA